MASALPRLVQLKLDQTLSQWRHWRCGYPLLKQPVIVKPLTGGLSNHSILVEERAQFVVRIDDVNPVALGLNRQAEWHAMQVANNHGVAPAPCYFNPDLGSLVSEYLPQDQTLRITLEDVAILLRSIHALPASHHRLDLGEKIQRYERKQRQAPARAHETLHKYRERVLQEVQTLQTTAGQPALCHNDLLEANRIASNGKVYAIDWEYAAMGDPFYDIAVIVGGDELDADQGDVLLQAYLGRAASAAENLRLRQYCCIYRYLELAWYFTLDEPADIETSLDEKLRSLETNFDAFLN